MIETDKKIKLKGTIKKIIYPRAKNIDSDFIVAVFGNAGAEVVITGNVYGIREKEEIVIEGEWVKHKKYGRQVKIISWERPVPTSKAQAIELLSSDLIKGCGPKTAKLIADALGDNAIDIIMAQKEACLTPIRGIGKNNASRIVTSLSDNFGVQNIIKHLGQYGVTTNMAIKLHKMYQSNAIAIIKENPYELTNLSMVGFDRADIIAKNMGIADDSPYRCAAAILHILREQDGHCYTNKSDLVQETLKLLNKTSSKRLTGSNITHALNILDEKRRIRNDNNRIYLERIYNYEVDSALKLGELMTAPCRPIPVELVDKEIKHYHKIHRFILNDKQRQAIHETFRNNILIITGGPGTGKTATTKAIVYIFKKIFPHKKIALCAPTGRASQKLAEVVGHEANTIHKLLNWGSKENKDENKALKNANNPLKEDLIIIDETSMADIELLSALLDATNPGTKLIFIGDSDQLPSVGPGAVIRDLINSPILHVRLTEIYRQAKNSFIIENAHRVNNGEMVYTNPSRKDFFFIEKPDPDSTVKCILVCIKRLMEQGYKSQDILVLSPMKKGLAGTVAIGEKIKELVNPHSSRKKELFVGNKAFRAGDIIIQNQKNNIDRGLYNGNMGIVLDIGPDIDTIIDGDTDPEIGLHCIINGDIVFLSRDDITEYDINTAYCITTHKSQGGQAKVVIAPVLTSHYIMLTRNILYTAITRAEEKLILVGQKKAAYIAIKNVKPNMRRTYLAERVKNILKNPGSNAFTNTV